MYINKYPFCSYQRSPVNRYRPGPQKIPTGNEELSILDEDFSSDSKEVQNLIRVWLNDDYYRLSRSVRLSGPNCSSSNSNVRPGSVTETIDRNGRKLNRSTLYHLNNRKTCRIEGLEAITYLYTYDEWYIMGGKTACCINIVIYNLFDDTKLFIGPLLLESINKNPKIIDLLNQLILTSIKHSSRQPTKIRGPDCNCTSYNPRHNWILSLDLGFY